MFYNTPGACTYCAGDLGEGITLCDQCAAHGSPVWERYRVAEQRARVARSTLRLRVRQLVERQRGSGIRRRT